MKIYFTTGISVTDSYFDFLAETQRIDIRDLVVQEKAINPKSKRNKFEITAAFLTNSLDDVLIANLLNSKDDFYLLKEVLEQKRGNVYKFFFKKNDSYSKYKEHYKEHSRWMDYAPAYIKAKQDEYNSKIDILVSTIVSENIDFEMI